jgi:hypothetical protein
MGSARNGAPDPKRARGLAHPTWPSRVRPGPMSGIATATPLRFPEAPARANPRLHRASPSRPASAGSASNPNSSTDSRGAALTLLQPRTEQMFHAQVLHRGPAGVRSPVDGLRANRGECIMPIRIRCRDKTLDRQNVIETKGLKTSSSAYPMAAYADRNPALRIFSRSV